jgi:hypothetical protein
MTDKNDNRTFDVRFYLKEAFANAARNHKDLSAQPGMAGDQRGEETSPELSTYILLYALLSIGYGVHNQLDEFQEYVEKHDAITDWEEAFPEENERKFHQQLLAMTKATLADPVKCEYLAREFTVEKLLEDTPQFQGAFTEGKEAEAIMNFVKVTLERFDMAGEGPRPTDGGVRKVYAPKRHPGTTVPHPGAK